MQKDKARIATLEQALTIALEELDTLRRMARDHQGVTHEAFITMYPPSRYMRHDALRQALNLPDDYSELQSIRGDAAQVTEGDAAQVTEGAAARVTVQHAEG